ncbi:hypothetical protein Cpin_0251 [Chitinophaga pinensis DSM 2588]|uniref:Uncharacterized protein n=1 Tax=Chitinophaga pinensis (strain ATCC 43595 / DSM 2588 / LMG 13176 / NBRC 15968 / NCIMB 11800 / UQM 2034) TaxID=485918 RepID=A0A979FZ16_CHIPD|nr:hypothetical protein Cpin_0251 [Chitinophaga pinensis DSM 2588]
MHNIKLSDEPILSFKLKQIRSQGNEDFEIYRVNKELVPGNTLFLQPHRRNYYQFVFVNEGSSSLWVDFQYYVFQPGRSYKINRHFPNGNTYQENYFFDHDHHFWSSQKYEC